MSEDNEKAELREFVRKLRKKERTPADPFAHGFEMLRNEEKLRPKDMHRLVSREVKLGNIDNDELMRIYVLEFQNLAHLASMCEDDNSLDSAFDFFYSSVIAEIGLTRAYKGRERKLQGGPGAADDSDGYGSRLDDIGGREHGNPPDGFRLPNFPRGRVNPDLFG